MDAAFRLAAARVVGFAAAVFSPAEGPAPPFRDLLGRRGGGAAKDLATVAELAPRVVFVVVDCSVALVGQGEEKEGLLASGDEKGIDSPS